jgi:hypothetical protein
LSTEAFDFLSALSVATNMRVAEVLSDLTSLRVCVSPSSLVLLRRLRTDNVITTQDPAAALALVSVRPDSPNTSTDALTDTPVKPEDNSDLQRAKDLIELHYAVKTPHASGEDKGLLEARRSVGELNF